MNSFLLEYIEKTQSGEILIGQELTQQLKMLQDDMANPAYVFSPKRARWRIRFMEGFCKQTKAPFYGKLLVLLLCQKAFLEALYGFTWADTGLRRFKKALLVVARKNFKTTFCSAIGMADLMIGPGGQDLCCSSNDDAQASLIFDEVNHMREQFDPKEKRTHKNQQGIFNLKNRSKVFKLSDRTRNKEGRNIDVGFLDESHEMKDNVIAKSIEQSQSTKDEPMFINITTEGFVTDGYLDKELIYARSILAGEKEDPTLLIWLYTQDSEAEVWQDESSWVKSNPSLGIIKKWGYLRDQMRKAQHDKAERAFTLAKDFNIKQNNSAAWLMEDEYTVEDTFTLEDLHGQVAIGGVDLAETTDLACAKALVMMPGSNKKFFLTKYFIPESKVEQGSIEDQKNYLEWARLGLIEVTPGNENDFSLITAWYVSLYKQLGLRFFMIGYDNALAKFWTEEMKDIGFEVERVNQNKESMSDPMKLVEADLKSDLLVYNANPIDRWCFGNTAMKIDGLGMIMPVKVNDMRNRRIDGAVATIIAYSIYMRHRTEYLNLVR